MVQDPLDDIVLDGVVNAARNTSINFLLGDAEWSSKGPCYVSFNEVDAPEYSSSTLAFMWAYLLI
jgi:hypothetical protein